MDTSSIKRMIGQCDNTAELAEVRRAADERSKLLVKRNIEKAEAAAWDRVKGLKHGDKLWCCADGFFLGGNIQCGTEMTVYCVQPKKKRLWVLLDNETRPNNWFGPGGINRYALKTEPSERKVSEEMKSSMSALGNELSKLGM